jgi:hypothetical protein
MNIDVRSVSHVEGWSPAGSAPARSSSAGLPQTISASTESMSPIAPQFSPGCVIS